MSLSSILHHLSCPKHVCARSKYSQDHGRRLTPICQPNTPRRLNPICEPNTEHHDNSARVRADEHKRATWMETPLRSSVLSFESCHCHQDRGGWRSLTRAHHRIIGTMQAHLRSCTVPENNSWLWWMLAVRAAQIQEAFCACDFGSHYRKRLRCFCNSFVRALVILCIVIVVMEDEVRFLRWLLLFHLRLIEERAIEVLASGSCRKPWCLFECPRKVAPGFRCDARVFLHFCADMQNPVCHETHHGVEAQVQHRLVPTHGLCKELHGLLFDAVFQRLLDRDVCWLRLRCVATRNEEHVALRMSSTDPFQQGGLSMDRGTIPQQHPVQEPLFSHPSAKPFDHLLACALGAREAGVSQAQDGMRALIKVFTKRPTNCFGREKT